ncbi:hypothetical protein BKA62DRAFT_827044 [Auriculariales sp. MPI-PUGE-AT-0066]|nr:hypothetical protein BKA62DRAFT_827044 [Auriculariales sp. MPI-PUGE-AT-0066]
MDDMFTNICRGIKSSGSTTPNEIILQYTKDKKLVQSSRQKAGCRGPGRLDCAGQYGDNWACSEFPFATSTQGGVHPAAMCVPSTHNALIGAILGNSLRTQAAGIKFRLKVTNFDCSTAVPAKREIIAADNQGSSKAAWYTPRQTSSGSAVVRNDTTSIVVNIGLLGLYNASAAYAFIAPLQTPDEQEFQGLMKVNWKVNQGTLKSGTILDDEGNTYWTINESPTGTVGQGTLGVAPEGVGNIIFLGWSDDPSIQVDVQRTLGDTGGGEDCKNCKNPFLTGQANRVDLRLGWPMLLSAVAAIAFC